MKVKSSITRFDLAFSVLCSQHRFSSSIAKISRIISKTGDGYFYVVLGFCLWGFDGARGETFLYTGLCSFLIELPIYFFSKNIFRRRRPHEMTPLVISFINPSDRFSLPSGHTAAAFLVAYLFTFFYPPFSMVAFAWACLIGCSRVFLGVHFFTDVIVGALLGVCAAHIGIVVMMEWIL